MGGKFYHLYLDESIFIDSITRNRIYGIAGVVVKGESIKAVRTEMGHLKINLWQDKLTYSSAKNEVLHFVDLKKANENFSKNYSIFKSRSKVKAAIEGIGDIIDRNELTILGCVVDLTAYEERFKIKANHYRGDMICLTEIINNFCCFLKWNNARGKIIFESRCTGSSDTADNKLKKQFYKIMNNGTHIYPAIELQKHVDTIRFIKKQENDAGLQIADFVVQPFLQNFCNQSQSKPSIYPILKKRRYSGELTFGGRNSNIYGVKYLK